MQKADIEHFVSEWLEAWNTHDLPRILSHYSDEIELYSPAVVQIAGQADGRLKGKSALGAYWGKALTLFPDLHFALLHTSIGVSSVAIHYLGVRNKRVTEVMHFNATGAVHQCHVLYEL